MSITRKHLSRRTFLRGAGVAVGLPLLESMIPAATALGQTVANPRIRLGFLYMPHGAMMSNWTPATEGTDFELSRILSPLKEVKNQVVVVSGLGHKNAGATNGDSGGDHGRSPTVFLSGSRPRRTEGEDVRAGMTVDQMAAAVIGQDTPLPSLELATEDMTGLIGACDVGFSCTYTNTNSWRTPSTPLPMEINPRVVFDSLFGDGSNATERLNRMQRQRSILDAVTAQVKRLQGKLGPGDRNRIAEYLEDVREEHSKLMMDLMALSFEAEITRVSTFMMAREVSYRTFPKIGVPDPFHSTSHHQDKPETLEKLTKINTYNVGLVAYLLEKLRSKQDGGATLLDNSLILYGSCMSNPNVHNHSPLPIFVAGGAAGKMKGGKHVRYPEGTPMANLLLTILDKAGIHKDSVGDSTGLLPEV